MRVGESLMFYIKTQSAQTHAVRFPNVKPTTRLDWEEWELAERYDKFKSNCSVLLTHRDMCYFDVSWLYNERQALSGKLTT